MKKKKKSLNYAKWGYIFILPFFACYFIFSLIPLVDTIRYSFFEYYRSGIKEIGPNFIGMANYVSLLESDMVKYAGNTMILWVIGFVPQIVIALLLAVWFTDIRMKIHGKQFFKVVMYLPNLIMASAFAMLFFTLFSSNGPINSILMSLGLITERIDFMGSAFGTSFKARMIYTIFAVLVAALAIYRHRANITRLLNGTENKLWKTKAEKLAEISKNSEETK